MPGPILPLNGLTVCYMAVPTLLTTLLKHYLSSRDHNQSAGARPELSFHEAFSVARSIVQRLSQYPVEDIQRLGNVFQPAPWTVRVIRVSIPATTCSAAAQLFIDTIGPDELRTVIGGKQWWQLRGTKHGTVEGEWIAMKRDLPNSAPSRASSPAKSTPTSAPSLSPTALAPPSRRRSVLGNIRHSLTPASKQPSPAIPAAPPSDHTRPATPPDDDESNQASYEDDLDKMPCMLYIHGGAFYFGSVNTHRYTIWRYARKMGGRAFAVNYRHAPQYPFPCALIDCLAAYLYLIQPPAEAKHRPIDPSKIVIAGDSAGGGLSLALLTLIRDAGLPLPAGAVLISPWVDLTHSFASVMDNVDTDIIPPYGFMHQPSALWPPPPASGSAQMQSTFPVDSGAPPSPPSSQPPTPLSPSPYKLKIDPELKLSIDPSDGVTPFVELQDGTKVLLNQQVQFYATNDQLTHPYCSPMFSPSLGGLPPLFIIAGDKEVLRDEIIYTAHRAAHPDRYPLREDLLNAHPGRKAKASQYPPTKVHLQVYDEMFHVLPLFSFLRPAKYCYRAIGSFCKHVTTPEVDPTVGSGTGSEAATPAATDERIPASFVHDVSDDEQGSVNTSHASTWANVTGTSCASHQLHTPPPSPLPVRPATKPTLPPIDPDAPVHISEATLAELEHTIYHASLPRRRPPYENGMIRERVGVDGKVRALEPENEIGALQARPEELGVLKAGPIKRWAEGRKIWERKFMRKYKKIQFERESHIKQSHKDEKNWIKESEVKLKKRQSLKAKEAKRQSLRAKEAQRSVSAGPRYPMVSLRRLSRGPTPRQSSGSSGDDEGAGSGGADTPLGRWCLDEDERPPPSSIAARKDTAEALKLLRTLDNQVESNHHIYRPWTAFTGGRGARMSSDN